MIRIFLGGVVALFLSLEAETGATETEATLVRRPEAPSTLSRIPTPVPAVPLMAFVDERTQDRHGVLLAEWALEVAKEGTFAVEWVRRPRVETWTSANRLASVRAMLDQVQSRKPTAVMMWGAVGWAATGRYDPDGHGPRVAWTDAPFAADFNGWTDTKNFGITYPLALGQNIPGDGKWDQIFEPLAWFRAKRSVGRVDFSNLKSSNPVSDVDEDVAMEDYLRRNLAYRRGQGFSNEVVFVSSLLSSSSKSAIKGGIVGRPVREIASVENMKVYPVAGQRFFAMYTSVVPYMREGFRDASGTMTSTLWTTLYKSFAADPWNVAESERQYLRQSLVVTFGGRHWLPNGDTVHEAYLKYSYPGLACLISEDTLLGDVTLKLK